MLNANVTMPVNRSVSVIPETAFLLIFLFSFLKIIVLVRLTFRVYETYRLKFFRNLCDGFENGSLDKSLQFLKGGKSVLHAYMNS